MPDYEILVGGPIGPVVASTLPGFIITTLPASTVLCGTAADPEDLLAVMTLLAAHGLPAIDTVITPHDQTDQQVRSAESHHQQRSPRTP